VESAKHVTGGLARAAKTDPSSVLKVFSVFSILSVGFILILAWTGLRLIYHGHIIREAETRAIGIAKLITELEKTTFTALDAGGRPAIFVPAEIFPSLDEKMRMYLHPLKIFKIKLYNRDRQIMYSTDRLIVGRVDSGNRSLETALKGGIISKIVKKGMILDLSGEQLSDVDVVETYLPIDNEKHGVIGSFEVYIDVTQLNRESGRVKSLSLSLLAGCLCAVFGFLFLLMRSQTIKLSAVEQALLAQATTDALTGIRNRGEILARAEDEFLKMRRGKLESIGVIMFDIDHFKGVNDRYGHPAGDKILRGAADRITRTIRSYDLSGRYGGEEFLIILPGATIEETKNTAERLRAAMREQPFPLPDGPIIVTVSLGVACADRNDDDFPAVLKRADDGLYKAKTEGRDRVCWI
jgi:diguanylate cyclase (GGDEF)-like protein